VSDFRYFVAATGYRTEAETQGGVYQPDGKGSNLRRSGTAWSAPGIVQDNNHPVVGVSWDDACYFCQWLTQREKAAGRLPDGYVFSLPTEAQWEYACRAGTTGPYAGELDSMAWYQANAGPGTHPVGQKQPNAWGLYDMHGNAWEWCFDFANAYPSDGVTDPIATRADTASQGWHTIRGGGWHSAANRCRSAVRNDVDRSYSENILGFRIALIPDPNSQASSTQSSTPASASASSQSGTIAQSDFALQLRAKAEWGDALAQDELGALYAVGGQGISRDMNEAIKWYRKSAEQGNVYGEANIGRALLTGDGVPVDYAEAAKWLEMAAAQNDSDSERLIGWMYYTGNGMAKDLAKSFEMYRRSAELGNEYSMGQLGIMCLYGLGVEKNGAEALRWCRAGAEKDAPQAEEMMGEFYDPAFNWGVLPPDVEEARKWYTKAAARGDSAAKDHLAKLTAAAAKPGN